MSWTQGLLHHRTLRHSSTGVRPVFIYRPRRGGIMACWVGLRRGFVRTVLSHDSNMMTLVLVDEHWTHELLITSPTLWPLDHHAHTASIAQQAENSPKSLETSVWSVSGETKIWFVNNWSDRIRFRRDEWLISYGCCSAVHDDQRLLLALRSDTKQYSGRSRESNRLYCRKFRAVDADDYVS